MQLDDAHIAQAKSFSLTNGDPGSGILWSHVNVGEAVPGVVTPLTAAFWHHSHTYVPRQMYREMGVLRASDLDDPFTPTNTPVQFIFGRMAANVDFLRFMADRLPGTSGAALEEQMLGSVRPDAVVHQDSSRYLPVALGFAKLLLTMRRRAHRLHDRTMARWRSVADRIDSADFDEALEVFTWETSTGQEDVIGTHGLTALLSPAVWEPLAALVRKFGSEDDVLALSAGLGGTEETDMMDELFLLTRNQGSLDEFVQRYGFMGPDNGELSSRSWREDPRALQAAQRAFTNPDAVRPATRQAQSERLAQESFTRLSAAMGPLGRIGFRLAAWLCRTYLPLREVGKACMIAHSDIGRMAARRIGALLVEQGALTDLEDVFYLLPDELAGPLDGTQLATLIAERKRTRALYQALPVPDSYTASDIPVIWEKLGQEEDAPAIIAGLGVSRGSVEGRVHVVMGPDDFDSFTAGDILVCKTTDPGWAPVFSIAGGMIVDIGGMLSHSAIIARELQVPAVVNTRNGTRLLTTGQRVRLNGETGAVELLDGQLQDIAVDQDDDGAMDPRTLKDPGVAALKEITADVEGVVLLQHATDEDLFGGKAASLARTLQAGLPVPPGIALSWQAVADLDTAALKNLFATIDGPVAVRSSGIGEDGADKSFAGQHDTVLGVAGADDILNAVKQVAASAHAAHVAHYRATMGEQDSQLRMGIVIQQLIPSRTAGVMFTRDPVGGSDARIVEAAWGLGEVVVGSLVTPDHLKLDPQTSTVIERQPGHKALYMDRDGIHKVTAQAAEAPCLTDGECAALNQLAAQCESLFGKPQDIEWAFAGGTLYLLQSRPITAS